MSQVSTPSPQPDLLALKQKQQANWASGDYAVIGTTLQIVGEMLCEAIDLRGGEQVLDVAGGNGNASLAAARRYASVTCTDYVPALLERARMRAQADSLLLDTRVADAEALPFPDGSFDAVLSTFGVMFTPDQEKAAAEMLRVCRPQGRIGLANWTPGGFVGQLFKLLGGFLPPPAGLRSPALWGTEERLRELFPGAGITATPRVFNFRYRSPTHWVEVFRTYYGPVHKAFLALEPDRQAELEKGITGLIGQFQRGGGPGVVIPSEYLEVVVRPGARA
ncbi:class I SAM-dependent methyltransferase [Roseomonas marmotae]|uniref:Methyltransferase domain-containing protein n=1 Tax=Roseomonas marmotae TaxID=2768161 RepID=A0ABS3K7W1_9PROT|nr:class I SAM-dependent methyltransferase [Roseomonas marmotae]MBO1073555.1 methyltransferase domain-containing protein [Roseomonas marmotae]QTI80260.1 methyltransferase domain-containing protein [Roseomonas marmotae]